MAEWKSANLKNLVPDAVLSVVDAVTSLLDTVTTVLNVVKGILNLVKGITGLAFDFLKTLRDTLIGIKNDFLFSGMYSCNMIDYPVRQLTMIDTYNYGPFMDYTKVPFGGHEFRLSFMKDLAASFYDMYDPNRPVFTNDCSMLLLVVSAGSLDALPIGPNGNIWSIFDGFIASSTKTIKKMDRIRGNYMFSLMKSYADVQEPKYSQAYFKRVAAAFRSYNKLSDDEVSSISSVPFDPITGQKFLMHTTKKDKDGYNVLDPSLLNWTIEVEPFLSEVELKAAKSTYPDWNRVSLKDINQGLCDLIDAVFDPLIDLFVVAPGGILQQITNLVNAIQKRIDYMAAIVDTMQAIVDRIDSILRTTGISVLFVNSTNGTEDLRTKMINATNSPFTSKGFFSGVAFLVGGTPVTIFNNTLGLIAT